MNQAEGYESSILEELNSEMRCCILSDANGTIIIVHDKDIKPELQWAEYDAHENTLGLVNEEGQVQDLGIKPDKIMRNNILHGMEIKLVKLENKKLNAEQTVVLIVKDYDKY